MRNVIVCKNCSKENSFYQLICINCNSFLRDRIYNIDLWKTVSLLIESPGKAFKDIIYSDHKNFIFFIVFLAAFKILLNSIWLSLAIAAQPKFAGFGLSYLIILLAFTLIIILFALIIKSTLTVYKVDTRFKDSFAILLFSFLPYLFALFILFPVELIIFGGNIFSNNPSPFMLKSFFAYTFLVLELIILLWTVSLTVIGIYSQSKSIWFSLLMGLLFNSIIFLCHYLFSILLYN